MRSLHHHDLPRYSVPLALCLCLLAVAAALADPPAPNHRFSQTIVPFLQKYCVDCHNPQEASGTVVLDRFTTRSEIQTEFSLWDDVYRMVRGHRMPPREVPPPSDSERTEFLRAIDLELDSYDCRLANDFPTVVVRRLNRYEYDRTVQALLGVESQPAEDFPSDDVGYGFDNVADVLAVSPLLVEKYLQSAESLIEQVFQDPQLKSRILRHPQKQLGQLGRIHGRNVEAFAELAFRRPLSASERQNLAELMGEALRPSDATEPDKTEQAARTAVTAILASPHFLFRDEHADPNVERDGRRGWLNDWALASRLAYFIWSSPPDERLRALAARGRLQDSQVLRREARRMLEDDRSYALAENFASQWLEIRRLDRSSPDPERFPQFDETLRESMAEETTRLFQHVLDENRSILEFIRADYTFVDETLSKFYGLGQVAPGDFHRVRLPESRRGILTHASVLTVTSNPTRTSPVKRGKWILDNVLGEPPPPPNVLPLTEPSGSSGESLRDTLERHRANSDCAVCHDQMDALGFGLENYSPVGQWRDRDGEVIVDAQGTLPDGAQFDGARELSEYLVRHQTESFARCLTEKLIIYALGRSLQPSDRCAIRSIPRSLASSEYRFQDLIVAIVGSEPFQSGPLPPE